MSESSIRAAIFNILSGITDIGMVYDYERWAADWATFINLFKTTIGGINQIRGWEIGRRSAKEDTWTVGENEVIQAFVIRGFLGVSDAAASEKIFNLLIEAIRDAFRSDITISVSPTFHDFIQGEVIDTRNFGGVLCHYCELTLAVHETVYL